MSLLTTIRRNPGYATSAFSPLFELQREFDRIFDRGNGNVEAAAYAPALDVQEDEQNVTVTAEVPGVNKDDVQVSYHDGVLTVAGERKREKDGKENGYHIRERVAGRFQRSVYVPVAVDANAVKAAYKDGVLTVTLPKAAEAKPRQISINAN
ncbi:MAG TPA: Hsp20/alpha crystallin family protein [Candidatus Limnocylindria bacterium]|jgi:HSP20 family protein|nr:Hsp20/alpha crystallin family protein [Candidatus Limnocylindria bacterium]